MVKIGVISDIHNNLLALESMLSLFEREKCDQIFCCGDMLGIGPYPEETIQKLMSLKKAFFAIGNHDWYLITGLTSPYPDEMKEEEAEHHRWEHSQLSDSSKEFIRVQDFGYAIKREGVKIAFFHYFTDEKNNFITINENLSPEDCDKMFKGIEADVVFHGHSHIPSVIKSVNRVYINCGSLGCPHE